MIDKDLRYAETHEWARIEEGVVTVGLSAYALEQLGDVVYLELPAVGDSVVKGEPFGVIESVKTASDMYSPVSGTVIAANDEIVGSLDVLQSDAYGGGWMMKIEVAGTDEYESLLDADAYENFLKSQEE
jgi:glycine cleavage system H protein